jgi:DedD protein
MEPALKTRLIGAAVLIAVAVIVVPMFFSGQPPQSEGGKNVSLALPASPDQELTTRTMSVAPPATASTVANAAASAPDADHLATVNIPSRRPVDVHPENDAVPVKSSTPTPAPAKTDTATRPAPDKPAPKPVKSAPAKPAATSKPASGPGQAAKGAYMVSLGAYSNSANARDLMRRVRALGYPAHAEKVTIADKIAARISAGPFSTRAAAETARLRLKQSIPSAPATLVDAADNQKGDAPASALPAGHAGGWAVQIGAYSHQDDALSVRKKLRAAGFDGYVDKVQTSGRTLWRVRVGPQTQRADAEKVRDRVKARLKLAGVVVTVP